MVALLPRYLVRYYKELYYPSDVDILKWVGKNNPDQCVVVRHNTDDASDDSSCSDYYNDSHIPGGAAALATRQRTREQGLGESLLPTPNLTRQRTDMSLGLEPINSRGFAFDQEDRMGETAVGRSLRNYNSSAYRVWSSDVLC